MKKTFLGLAAATLLASVASTASAMIVSMRNCSPASFIRVRRSV